MADGENFLSRWSRRKSEAKDPERAIAPAAEREPAAAPPALPGGAPPGPAPLPPVESLTPESDFTPFMAPEVDGDVRREALKTLFSDPRYNVMDMMDVYVDDYSKPDPIPESWMGKLEQLSRLGDRAGRDREEAERRRALAHEQAEALDSTPAEGGGEMAESAPELDGEDVTAPRGNAGESDPDADGDSRRAIPVVDVGDSSA